MPHSCVLDDCSQVAFITEVSKFMSVNMLVAYMNMSCR